MLTTLPQYTASPVPCDEALPREQYRMLTRLVPVLYAVILLVTVIVATCFRDTAPGWLVFGCPAVLSLLILVRMRHWIRSRRIVDELPIERIRSEIRAVNWFAPALTLAFGLIGVALTRYGDPQQQTLAVICIWIIATASGLGLYAIAQAPILVVLAATVPTALVMLQSGHVLTMQLAPMFVAVSGLIIFMLRETNKTFVAIVQSRSVVDASRAQAEQAREMVATLAYTDMLTGLANRRRFEAHLSGRGRQEDGRREPFVVAMLDVDGFKPVNDVHGHHVGDQIIREVAARLTAEIGQDGLVARMGGDEFAILLDGRRDADEAFALAERIHRVFREPFRHDSVEVRLRATIGLALNDGSEASEAYAEHADTALHHAKSQRRGGTAIFSSELAAAARQHAEIEQALREAIEAEDFDVHFQPILAIGSNRIVGFEALARWRHAQKGPISPALFIPIAEQIGVIEPLTDILLRKAASAAARWPADVFLSFNLSADQLIKPGASLRILAALAQAGLPPSRFEAEVTETAIMRDVETAQATIVNLRAAGVHVTLDDFGTGYSSFSQLRHLSLDKLKIDKSFIDSIAGDHRAASLVNGIISMCSDLDLDCVAEGIEHTDQLAMVKGMGCNAAQGYLISRPLSPEATMVLLGVSDRRLCA